MKYQVQKPFIKWVGGKTQLLESILDIFPKNMENYHEIFLGGGSVLLAILSLQRDGIIQIKKKVFAYDINPILIQLYQHIQKNVEEVYTHFQHFMKVYDGLKGTTIDRKPANEKDALTSKESYYYWLRATFNKKDKQTIESSALFLFLNKTCFRGMYREGSNGFNVPYGHYKKTPQILSLEEFKSIQELIQPVIFKCCDFKESLKNVGKNDFVYLDPPYAPENSTSFVNYVADGFDLDTHTTLFEHVKGLKGVQFVTSNANVPLVRNAFQEYSCIEIEARRAIHSKNPSKKTIEVFIHNLS